jgi:hypothetical protein
MPRAPGLPTSGPAKCTVSPAIRCDPLRHRRLRAYRETIQSRGGQSGPFVFRADCTPIRTTPRKTHADMAYSKPPTATPHQSQYGVACAAAMLLSHAWRTTIREEPTL